MRAVADARDPGKRADRDWRSLKSELAIAQSLVVDLQAQVIAGHVRGRLRRLEHLEKIETGAVIQADGHVDLHELDLRVSDLLRRMPELAAPPANIVGFDVE